MAVTFRQTRRTASILLIFVNNFLNGLEYSIILPSLWKYLRSQGTTTELFFGIVVSSFNFAATLSGILAGCCADETGRAKKITILFSLFQVTGNLLYFVGGSPGVLLLSRLVAGFGAGSMTALYSEINRSTTPKERTPLLTGIFLMYHFSILLGPAINKALYSIHGRFGNFWVHGENAGGLVLGIAWAVYFVVFTLIFSNDLPALAAPDPATLIEIDESEKTRLLSNSREHSERSSLALQRHVPYGAATNLNDVHRTSAEGYSRLTASAPQLNVEDDTTPSWSSMENSDTAVDDLAMLMVRSCDVMVNSSKENNAHLKPPDDENGDQHTSSLTLPRAKTAAPAVHMTPYFTPKSHHRHIRRRSGARGRGSSRAKRRRDKGCAGALTDEVLIALLFLQTVTMFVDTMIETTIPPTLERFFGYGPVGNSLLFMAISLGTLFIFVLLTIMSSWIPDLAIAVFGSLFMLVLVAGLLVLSTYYGTVESSVLFFAVYVALVVLCFTSSAAVAISTMTLMTKAIPFERQGKALKFRRAATFVGVVLGPLWAGGLMLRPVYMLGSGVAMIFVAFCITTLSVRTILARLGRPAG